MSLRGKHCFKTKVLQSKDHHVVNASQESGWNGPMFTNSDSKKEECDDERFS